MEKKQNLIIAGIITIVLITFLGFFKPYFIKFPLFENTHLFTFSCWFVLLILQPILIRQKKLELHKKVGSLSYFLAPILSLTILFMVFDQLSYFNKTKSNEGVYIKMLAGSLGSIFFYYLLHHSDV